MWEIFSEVEINDILEARNVGLYKYYHYDFCG